MSRRLVAWLALLGLWAGVVGARLYRLQVVRHEEYRSRALRQQRGEVELHPPRGTIYDARGRQLAVSMAVDSAFAVPPEVEDPKAAAAALAPILGVSVADLEKRLSEDATFVWVARQLDAPVAEAVRALEIAGVHFLEESKRYYPQGDLAGQVLGFVGVDDEGLGGLEALWDDTVAGLPMTRRILRDARRGKGLYPDLSLAEPLPGEDVHLTLDATIQYVLERELDKSVAEFGARSGVGVVLDPSTGAVLAMASRPAFDPNRFREMPEERRRNRAIADAYEPGSTFKLITAAAALENNLADPSDVFDCGRGSLVVHGKKINDHRSFDRLSFRDVIALSSNVGAMRLGMLAGEERLYRTIRGFGFGRRTGIDLPGESPGLLWSLDRWQKRSIAYVSFGQEISVTPLQLALGFAAIANGGVMLEPYIVDAVGRGDDLEWLHLDRREAGRAISPATARSLERMLEAVVSEGTGKKAAVPGYTAAGKTGTAQKAVPGRGYVPGRYVASFVGFAPARDPRLVTLIAVDEPAGARFHGGDVAAGVFAAVMKQALFHLGVPPDQRDGEPWPEARTAATSPTSGRTSALR